MANPTTENAKDACIVEALESTRKRLESTLPKDHEDRIAGKGFNSLSQCCLVHKVILMHQALKILDAKAAVVGEVRKNAHMAEVKSKT